MSTSRKFAIVWLVMGLAFLVLGIVGLRLQVGLFHGVPNIAIGLAWLGLSWWYWSRARAA